MKKQIFLLAVILFTLTGFVHGKSKDDKDKDDKDKDKKTVILVYRSRVNAYRHEKDGNAWKYNGDGAKQYYYHVLEFDPEKREFKDRATRIIYSDGKQSQEDGLYFNECEKAPKDGENKPYMNYLVGSSFETKGKSDAVGEILYGNIVLANTVDVGWKEKIAVARSLKGKSNAEGKDYWNNFVLNSRLDMTYTKIANEDGLSVKDTVKLISDDLKKKGYDD